MCSGVLLLCVIKKMHQITQQDSCLQPSLLLGSVTDLLKPQNLGGSGADLLKGTCVHWCIDFVWKSKMEMCTQCIYNTLWYAMEYMFQCTFSNVLLAAFLNAHVIFKWSHTKCDLLSLKKWILQEMQILDCLSCSSRDIGFRGIWRMGNCNKTLTAPLPKKKLGALQPKELWPYAWNCHQKSGHPPCITFEYRNR